jgi:hypothetical protein
MTTSHGRAYDLSADVSSDGPFVIKERAGKRQERILA